MRETLTLTNDFHQTAATVHPIDGVISQRAYLAACVNLCGIKDCQCGSVRGAQTDRHGYQVYLERINPQGDMRVIRTTERIPDEQAHR